VVERAAEFESQGSGHGGSIAISGGGGKRQDLTLFFARLQGLGNDGGRCLIFNPSVPNLFLFVGILQIGFLLPILDSEL
jgi:hypothetical protein